MKMKHLCMANSAVYAPTLLDEQRFTPFDSAHSIAYHVSTVRSLIQLLDDSNQLEKLIICVLVDLGITIRMQPLQSLGLDKYIIKMVNYVGYRPT